MDGLIEFIKDIPVLLWPLFIVWAFIGWNSKGLRSICNSIIEKRESKKWRKINQRKTSHIHDIEELKYYPLFFGKREDKVQDIQVGTINASDENTWYRDAVWMVQNTDGTISLHMEKPKLDPVTGIYISARCLCLSVPILPPPNIRPGEPPVLICMIVQELDPNTGLNIIKN